MKRFDTFDFNNGESVILWNNKVEGFNEIFIDRFDLYKLLSFNGLDSKLSEIDADIENGGECYYNIDNLNKDIEISNSDYFGELYAFLHLARVMCSY